MDHGFTKDDKINPPWGESSNLSSGEGKGGFERVSSDEDRGFKITDRRRFSGKEGGKEGEEKEEGKETKKEGKSEERREEPPPLPPVDFSTFIYSLATSVLFHLGDISDPKTSKKEKNLPMAKHTIDTIGMLKEKTKGNLTNEEARLIDELLYTLRMRYLKETR